jgi:hypothetical protein
MSSIKKIHFGSTLAIGLFFLFTNFSSQEKFAHCTEPNLSNNSTAIGTLTFNDSHNLLQHADSIKIEIYQLYPLPIGVPHHHISEKKQRSQSLGLLEMRFNPMNEQIKLYAGHLNPKNLSLAEKNHLCLRAMKKTKILFGYDVLFISNKSGSPLPIARAKSDFLSVGNTYSTSRHLLDVTK